jgi:hypothetical protein
MLQRYDTRTFAHDIMPVIQNTITITISPGYRAAREKGASA